MTAVKVIQKTKKWRSIEFKMALPQSIYDSLYIEFVVLIRINDEVLKAKYIISDIYGLVKD